MRKRKLWIALISLVFAAVIAVEGCGSSSDGGGYSPVTLGKPTMIVGDLPSDNPILADFETDRVTNKVHDITEAEVLIINNDVVTTQLDVTPAEFKTFFERGGFVILVQPVTPELQMLSTWTGAHISAPADGPLSTDGFSIPETNGDVRFADIYAFYNDPHSAEEPSTGFHTYVLGGPPNRYDGITGTEITYTDQDGNKVTELGTPFEPRASTKWETREMLDHFIEWVNNNGPKGARERLASVKVNLNSQLNATPEDVKNLIQAQTWTFNIEANSTGGQSMDETNVAGDHHSPNKANYTNTYFVYAFYAAGDTTTTPPKLPYDYYIVDQEAQVRSGNMYYGQWENNRFLGHTHNMAYYLADYYTDHYIVDSVANKYLLDSQVNIISPSPTTTTKSNTITTSISESFTGSLGFSGMGGTGGVSGGLSYSSSSTLNVPDMSVVFQGGMDTPYVSASSSIKKNARWTYQPALPTAVDNTNMFAPVAYYISDPPAISTSTAVFHNTWIWQVVNPAIDAKYRIISHSIPRHAWSILQKNWYTNPIRGHFDHYYMNLMAGDESTYYYANWVKYSLELIPPPRNLSAP